MTRRRNDVRTNRSGHVFQVLLNDLRQRIRKGEWQPGEYLPSITHLAHTMHVSTGSVREALRSLQSMGVVRIEHGRGVIVVSARANEHRDSANDQPNLTNVIALAEARRLIEPELAALAAERGLDSELSTIKQLAITMEIQANSGVDFVNPDTAFHAAIAQAAHNPVLQQMLATMHPLFMVSRLITSQEPGMTDRAVRYHHLIAEAIFERNPTQARLLMLAHMNDVVSSVLALEAQQQALQQSTDM